MDRFDVDAKTPETYEHWVNLTAKLLNRPYFSVHKIFERERWTVDKIQQRYELCTKHRGTMPGDVKWWWLRKQDNETKKRLRG